MRPRHTRRTDGALTGETVQKSVRLPVNLYNEVIGDINEGIPEVHTLIDAVCDALWLWHYENARDRRTELWREEYKPITVTFEPQQLTVEDQIDGVLPEGSTIVLTENGGHIERPNWSDVDPELVDEDPTPDLF